MENQIDYHEFRRQKKEDFPEKGEKQGGFWSLFAAEMILVLLTAIILLVINICSPHALDEVKIFLKNQILGDEGITQTVEDVFEDVTGFLTESGSNSTSSGSEDASASDSDQSASSSESDEGSSDSSSGSSEDSSSDSAIQTTSVSESALFPYGMGMGGEENPLPLSIESPVLGESSKQTSQEDVVPIHGTLSCGYGYRIHPITGLADFHKGIDIPAEEGTPIAAFRSGTVVQAQASVSFGNFVAIQHENGVISRYGHCSSLNVQVGDTVNAGDVIGFVGNTGYSTGNHCHFDLSVNGVFINPLDVIPYTVQAGYVTV